MKKVATVSLLTVALLIAGVAYANSIGDRSGCGMHDTPSVGSLSTPTSSTNCVLKDKTHLENGYFSYDFQSIKKDGSLQVVIVKSKSDFEARKICKIEFGNHEIIRQ